MDRASFLRHSASLAAGAMLAPLAAWAEGMPDKKIRVALIGCGSVSGVYLPHLTASPYVEVVSVCDILLDRAERRASEFKVPNRYASIEKMLTGVPFDLMVNLTDMQEHGKLNRLALSAGRNVWSEKPLANSYKEGKALLDLAYSKKIRLWGAPAVVNSPQFAFMARSILDGKLGKVSAAHAHYGHTGPSWSAFFYEKGGGSLPDLGVYNLASLTGLLGPALSVMAMTSIVTKERTVDNKGKIRVEAEDNAMVLMDHGNGIISHVQCGFNYFDPYGHEGKGQDRPTISIWGTHGNMALVGYDWAPFGVDLAVSWTEKPIRYEPDPKDYVWQQGASVVAESLLKATEPRINVEHALHVLEVIEAARTSGQTGQRIKLTSTFKYPMI